MRCKIKVEDIKKLVIWREKNDLFTLINLAAPTGRLAGKKVRIQEFKEEYYLCMDITLFFLQAFVSFLPIIRNCLPINGQSQGNLRYSLTKKRDGVLPVDIE